MKRTTSLDVAKRAGVSQATVSLILNSADHFAFSDDTRERVFEAVRTLDYRLPTRKKKAII
ncbi:MAG: helix-turn-helix domain-containing protein, partial [Clostridia bacterium]